jgi:hypothetical protein
MITIRIEMKGLDFRDVTQHTDTQTKIQINHKHHEQIAHKPHK